MAVRDLRELLSACQKLGPRNPFQTVRAQKAAKIDLTNKRMENKISWEHHGKNRYYIWSSQTASKIDFTSKPPAGDKSGVHNG